MFTLRRRVGFEQQLVLATEGPSWEYLCSVGLKRHMVSSRIARDVHTAEEGRYKATWRREFKFPWREASPQHHLDDEVDSDQ